ncbi:MAG: hypothetical protein HZA52_17080 [Planctomycetes bacterium]|nr:hypothetical protein [Planctomycetota bacterium]
MPAYRPGASPDDPRIELLRDGSPREILARLAEGDPLGIRRLAAELVARGAWLIDAERLSHRALARIAFEARRRAPNVALDPWLELQLETAAHELNEEQREELFARRPIETSPDVEFYRTLADAMQVDIGLVRVVCVRANRLPEDRRRVFHALAVRRLSVDDCVRAGLGSERRVLELFAQATLAITATLEQFKDGRSEGEVAS